MESGISVRAERRPAAVRRAVSLSSVALEPLCAATFAHWSGHKYSLLNGVLANLAPPARTVGLLNEALAHQPPPAPRCCHCRAPPLRLLRADVSGSVADGVDGTHLFGTRPWPDSDYDYMLQLDGEVTLVEGGDGDSDEDGEGDDDDREGVDEENCGGDEDDAVNAHNVFHAGINCDDGANDEDTDTGAVSCPDSDVPSGVSAAADSDDITGGNDCESPAEPQPRTAASARYVAVPSRRHLGYYRVFLRRSPGCQHALPVPLSAGAVRDALAAAARASGLQTVTQRGPAVTRHHGWFDVDLVPYLRAPGAGDWLTELRARGGGQADWPPADLLRRLSPELLLVPVGPTPEDRRLWRVSFSRPEALLARALPTRARFCLMLLRGVRRRCRDDVPLLSSYQLKTCTFWACERRPAAAWRDTLGSLRAVLELLESAVTAGRLPCYLRPEVNVLRQPTAERRRQLLRDVRYLRLRLARDLPAVLATFS